MNPPYSVFCHTDQLAIGVMRALCDRGLRISEDVAVIGVDDINSAHYLHPALTTVALPKDQIGRLRAEMLISLIDGWPVETRQVLPEPEPVVRETA